MILKIQVFYLTAQFNSNFFSNILLITGWIKTKDWTHLLANYLKSKHIDITEKQLFILKDHFLPCDEKGLANYSKMFQKSLKSTARQAYNLLDSIFALIDTDQNGTISSDEANEAVQQMNSLLGATYSTKFITDMVLNKDGVIDIKEFKLAFENAFDLKQNS